MANQQTPELRELVITYALNDLFEFMLL
jgi:hypothetical protein